VTMGNIAMYKYSSSTPLFLHALCTSSSRSILGYRIISLGYFKAGEQ
jgi:hypothetical protein